MYSYSNPNMIKQGLSFLKNVKWSTLLDGTQKTLGVINQAIPIVYQVKPMVTNAKTLFKIVNSVNNTPNQNIEETKQVDTNHNNSPIFYI